MDLEMLKKQMEDHDDECNMKPRTKQQILEKVIDHI